MVRRRVVPPVEQLLAELALDDAPREAPDAHALQGILDFALYLAEHKKKVSFPGFTWSDPFFVAEDAKISLRIVYAELAGDVAMTLDANLDRMREGRSILALDARRSGLREFDVGHALYGEPTLFQFPSKPVESADPRVDAARNAGWVKVLKEHNLMPGRGIVVLDEHQGLLLREERFAAYLGFLILFETGLTSLWWNPFARGADPDLQYWIAWGAGTGPASGWKEAFFVESDDE